MYKEGKRGKEEGMRSERAGNGKGKHLDLGKGEEEGREKVWGMGITGEEEGE